MELKKFVPWNWFKKEEAAQAESPPSRLDAHPIFQLQRELDRLFEHLMTPPGPAAPPFGLARPLANVSETADEYRLDLELPGVDAPDLELTLRDGTLTVKGEKKSEAEDQNRNFHRLERRYGFFQRVFSLPQDADEEKVDASFKNGLLSIRIGRRATPPEPEGRKIAIQAGDEIS